MDELDREIEKILANTDEDDPRLPTDPDAITLVRMDVELARQLASLPETKRLPIRVATPLKNAAARLLETAADYALATPQELRAVRRLKWRAEFDELLPAYTGTEIRPWLWPCSKLFASTWWDLVAPTQWPPRKGEDGLWEWSEVSPALKFVEACCKLVDREVNRSARLYAKEKLGAEDASNGDEDGGAAAYESWCETPIGRKFFERED